MVVFIGYKGLKARGLNYTPQHISRLVKAGKFPAPVQLTPGGRNNWAEHEIDAHLERLLAARNHTNEKARTA
jgi:prophage regulatory protein